MNDVSLWGTFSVADHLRRRPFVADVLLYDRLIVPVPDGDDEVQRLRRYRAGRDMRGSSSSTHQTRPLAITDDGAFAVTALWGDNLRVWQLRGPSSPRTLYEGTQAEAVAALPGGLTVQLWDLRAMESLAGFTLDDFPTVCALTADGETAIVGDRRSLHLLKFHNRTP